MLVRATSRRARAPVKADTNATKFRTRVAAPSRLASRFAVTSASALASFKVTSLPSSTTNKWIQCARRYTTERSAPLAPVKFTTGIVGLDVQPHGREILTKVYTAILAEASKNLDAKNIYRQTLENMFLPRIKILNENTDILQIEKLIGQGQIEELIDAAEQELNQVMPMMLREKPWETDRWDKPWLIWSNVRNVH